MREPEITVTITIELTPEQRAAFRQQVIAALLPRVIEIIHQRRQQQSTILALPVVELKKVA